jgi:hypothetical protein
MPRYERLRRRVDMRQFTLDEYDVHIQKNIEDRDLRIVLVMFKDKRVIVLAKEK